LGLRLALASQDIASDDRQDLLAFLSAKEGYAPQSGEIVGILKQISDEMSKGLSEATAAETAAIEDYEAMMAAKKKEITALGASIEAKTKAIGELGISIVQMKEDQDDTAAALAEDKKFLAGLEESCKTKTAEWEVRQKGRAEELVALADTIKILNDDDALELFKKTLPSASASFVQVSVTAASARAEALSAVRSLQRGGSPPNMKDMVSELEQQAIVWELERRTSVFTEDWRAPFLPHDGQKQIGWVAFEDELRYVQHPFIPKDMDDLAARACTAPPIPEVEFLGQMRLCSWDVEIGIDTDDDGWQYVFGFV